MTSFARLSVLVVMLLVAASCSTAQPAPDITADVAKIADVRNAWAKAFGAADMAALGALYTDDAIVMAPGQPATVGKDAIVQMWTAMHAQYTCNATLTAEETKVIGDWAFDRGQYMMTTTPKTPPDPKTLQPGMTGMTMEMGKYIVILQKQADGNWKIAREIGNANGPVMQH